MWLARRKQLLFHDEAHIKCWQMRAIEAGIQILRGENEATIQEGIAGLIVGAEQDGWERQRDGPIFELAEGPDPLQ
jgi:hypothetical protein